MDRNSVERTTGSEVKRRLPLAAVAVVLATGVGGVVLVDGLDAKASSHDKQDLAVRIGKDGFEFVEVKQVPNEVLGDRAEAAFSVGSCVVQNAALKAVDSATHMPTGLDDLTEPSSSGLCLALDQLHFD